MTVTAIQNACVAGVMGGISTGRFVGSFVPTNYSAIANVARAIADEFIIKNAASGAAIADGDNGNVTALVSAAAFGAVVGCGYTSVNPADYAVIAQQIYASAKQGLTKLAPTTGPGPSATGDASSSIGPFATASYFAGDATSVQFSPGSTLFLLVELRTNATQIPWLFAHGPTGGSKGWYFSFASTGAFSLVLQGGSGSLSITTGLKDQGLLLCVAITHKLDGSVRFSLNGLDVVQATAAAVYVPNDGGTQHLIGRAPSGEGFSTTAVCTGMTVIGLGYRTAESSDAELIDFSNVPNTINPAKPPQSLRDAVTANGGFVFYPHTDWNGVSPTMTPGLGNVTPVWTRVTGTPAKNSIPAYARYETANVPEVWHDNKRFDLFGGYYQHDFIGRIRFMTDATEVICGTVYNNTGVVNSTNIGMVDGGVDQQPHGLHAIGFNQIQGSGIRRSGLTPGYREIQFLEGFKSRIPPSGLNLWTSVYQQWFMVPANAAFAWVMPSRPTKRIVILGDSMSDKINPTTFITSPTYQTWPRLIRNAIPATSMLASVSASGAGLYHYAGPLGDTPTLQSLGNLLISLLDGTAENIFMLELGINDWSQSLQSLANYKTVYEQLIDYVKAANLPGFQFIALGPTTVFDEATPNSFGYVLQDVRDANAASVAARASWASYVDGSTLATPVTDYGPDGVHFNVAPDGVGARGGHKNYYDALTAHYPQLLTP